MGREWKAQHLLTLIRKSLLSQTRNQPIILDAVGERAGLFDIQQAMYYS